MPVSAPADDGAVPALELGALTGYETDATAAVSDDSDADDSASSAATAKPTFSLERLIEETPSKIRVAEFSESCKPVPREAKHRRPPPPRGPSDRPANHLELIPPAGLAKVRDVAMYTSIDMSRRDPDSRFGRSEPILTRFRRPLSWDEPIHVWATAGVCQRGAVIGVVHVRRRTAGDGIVHVRSPPPAVIDIFSGLDMPRHRPVRSRCLSSLRRDIRVPLRISVVCTSRALFISVHSSGGH